jgi:ribonuclease HI
MEPKVEAVSGLHVYADGCFEPHSKTGGWAFIAYRDGVEIASSNGCVHHAASNAMELTALLQATLWINAHSAGEATTLWSDSVYAVNGANQWRPIWKNWGWRKKGSNPNARSRPIADQELWIALDAALSDCPNMRVSWCKGHSDIPGNERADMLAEHGRRSYGAISHGPV